VKGVARCRRYVKAVLHGGLVVPKPIKCACRQFEKDFDISDIYFDEKSANIAVAAIESF